MSTELNQVTIQTPVGPFNVTVWRDSFTAAAEDVVINGVEYIMVRVYGKLVSPGQWYPENFTAYRRDARVATQGAFDFVRREVFDKVVERLGQDKHLARTGEIASLESEIRILTGERDRLLSRFGEIDTEMEQLRVRLDQAKEEWVEGLMEEEVGQ